MKREDIASWVAMIVVLIAYFLAAYGFINSKGALFNGLNFTGGVLFVYFGYRKKLWAVVALNTIWSFMALGAVIRYFVKF